MSYGFDCTCAGSLVTGARTGGAGAIVPWNVRPTTTVSIAPFWSGAIVRGTFLTSAGANSLATEFAAAADRLTRGFQ